MEGSISKRNRTIFLTILFIALLTLMIVPRLVFADRAVVGFPPPLKNSKLNL